MTGAIWVKGIPRRDLRSRSLNTIFRENRKPTPRPGHPTVQERDERHVYRLVKGGSDDEAEKYHGIDADVVLVCRLSGPGPCDAFMGRLPLGATDQPVHGATWRRRVIRLGRTAQDRVLGLEPVRRVGPRRQIARRRAQPEELSSHERAGGGLQLVLRK